MKHVLKYSKPYLGFLTVTLLIKAVGSVLDLVIPYLLGKIIDEVAPQCTPDRLWPIFLWGGLMVLCAATIVFCNIFANRQISRYARDVVRKLRQDSFDKILSLSAAQTDRFTIPSLVSRMSSDTYSINGMLNSVFRAGIRAPLLLIGGVGITLAVDPVLSLSLIVMLPLMALIVTFISKKGIRLFKEKQKKVDTMVEKVRDSFTGVRVIKALSKVEYEKKSFEGISDDLSHSEERASIAMGSSRPVVSIFLNLGMTAVIALGAWRVAGGHAMPGQIISFMTYFTIILNATLVITRVFTVVSRGIASADRISEILDAPADLLVEEASLPIETAPFLEFRDVTFSYNKTIPTVEHISFTLEQGQTLGIIGSTGSGKTTLIQLLMRFYDPDEGQIFLEGRDLKTIPQEELRSRFGVVFQNDFLMADTLEENVRFARPLSEEAVEKGVTCAQAGEFISQIPEKMQYCLTSKGANLSGGQRQRILISRALAGNPEILVLDDSSSALDYKTDSLLRKGIEENYAHATRVIVAQRVSSIRSADLILVLEHGELIGTGTDESLLQNCEVYREIAHSQMGEMTV